VTSPLTLTLRRDHITLAQALKAAGIASSGGRAKQLVRSGVVTVNDGVATRPGQKLLPGDRFRVGQGEEWTIAR
jgi:ribosome-associated protein